MTNIERIRAMSAEELADLLARIAYRSMENPWSEQFERLFCGKCGAKNCDAENCPHQAEKNSPAWWLRQAYTENGPVRTTSLDPYRQQAAGLRLEALHQRVRFGRNMLATELEAAASTIEVLINKLEGIA